MRSSRKVYLIVIPVSSRIFARQNRSGTTYLMTHCCLFEGYVSILHDIVLTKVLATINRIVSLRGLERR
jgi:hypothetical protein